MIPPADARRTRLLAALFVASGAVALGCETVWFRALALLFGSTLAATGTLLAVFMSGLALGGELGARLADRMRHPARGYAVAELVVALSALSSPAAFHATRDLALAVSAPARVLLAVVLLAPATTAMGATLPFLAAATVVRRDQLRAGIGLLYALNVLGAAFGALCTGYFLLPRVGLVTTTHVLGAIGLVTAACAFALSSAVTSSRAVTSARPGEPLAIVVASGIGVLTFALQVTWNRVFALLLGSSAYTFGLVAAVVLGASALGGAWGRRDDEDPWPAIARRCLLFAIAVYLGTLVIYVAPQPLAAAAARGASMRWLRLGLVAGVVGAPSFIAGALFPALAARFPVADVGRASGRAQFVVTAGNVAGALVASFLGVPLLGSQRVLLAVAALALVIACIAATPSGFDRFRGTALASVLAVGFAYAVHPAWDRAALSAGSFRVSAYREAHDRADAPCGPARHFGRHRVLFAREGALATVVVLGHPGGDDCSLYSLRINGKAEGSVFVRAPLADRVQPGATVLPIGDLPTEVLAGWLPGALASPHARALLVGWGTGLSTRGLLATSPDAVLGIEIEPVVLDAARLFEPSALRDPRVTLLVDDARIALARQPSGSLDIVASHPSNPWVVGAGSLFSREYFALARSRLRAGGRMLAWVQLYDSDRDVVRGQLATFRSAFPDTFVIRPTSTAHDLLLLGIVPPGPRDRLSLTATLQAIGSPAALDELRRAGFARPDDLAASVLAAPDDLARITAGARIHGEDDAWVEFRVADHLLRGDGEPPEAIIRALFGATR